MFSVARKLSNNHFLQPPPSPARHPLKSTLSEKRALKRCPWGTIATNGTYLSKGHSLSLNNHVYGLVLDT